MKDKVFTKEDYKIYLSKRSEVFQDFLYHVISKFGKTDEYTKEQFIKEYSELPKTTKVTGHGTKRGSHYGKNEWKTLKKHGY